MRELHSRIRFLVALIRYILYACKHRTFATAAIELQALLLGALGGEIQPYRGS